MKQYLNIIKNSQLFKGIEFEDILSVLGCLSSKTKHYQKDEILIITGEKLQNIGIVLDGQVQILQEDVSGNRTILSSIYPSEIYGEAICCAGIDQSPVTVLASEDSTVLLLDFARILQICSNVCSFHSKLIENMLYIISRKNIFLQNRMDIVSKKSVRTKIIMYLENFNKKYGEEFHIPLNREQMSEYLCVDRSALSHELMKMKKDGIVEYNKNIFKLFNKTNKNPQETQTRPKKKL